MSIATVESQIKAWYSFYPGNIAGIFFDRASDTIPGTTTSNVTYYRTLDSTTCTRTGQQRRGRAQLRRQPRLRWMFNSSNANNADIVVTFESRQRPGLNTYTSWTPAAWEASYPASDFAALIYDAGESADPSRFGVRLAGSAEHRLRLRRDVVRQLPPYFSTFAADAAAGAC